MFNLFQSKSKKLEATQKKLKNQVVELETILNIAQDLLQEIQPLKSDIAEIEAKFISNGKKYQKLGKLATRIVQQYHSDNRGRFEIATIAEKAGYMLKPLQMPMYCNIVECRASSGDWLFLTLKDYQDLESKIVQLKVKIQELKNQIKNQKYELEILYQLKF